MARKQLVRSTGRTILLVDDNEEYLASTAMVVARDGHEVLTATGAAEGLDVLRKHHVDLVLVDYFMPCMTGEEFVTELRTFNSHVQVILQTGYSSERPPREMLRQLDIQGYHDKSEGPEKLGLWIDVGLKAAFTVQLLTKSRQGLAYILGVTPELHRIQPVDDLLQGVLLQTAGLLGAVDSFVAVPSVLAEAPARDGFLATPSQNGGLSIRAGTGRFASKGILDESQISELGESPDALTSGAVVRFATATVLPLRVGELTCGVIYVDRAVAAGTDTELLTVFANQAAVAIQNASLYELAAIDPLTRVYSRRFFEQALLRELKTAYREDTALSLLVVDVDDMKSLNDGGGHLAGDQALQGVGELLRETTRASDFVGRFGGDEFAVVLPRTDAAGAAVVARRIVERCPGLRVAGAGGRLVTVSLSVGAATLTARSGATPTVLRPEAYFLERARALFSNADAGLYTAKRAGKGQAGEGGQAAWADGGAGEPAPSVDGRSSVHGDGESACG